MTAENTKVRPAKITDIQARVLCYIDEEAGQDVLGRSPRLKIIAKRFGVTTPTVWEHIERLKRKKCIEGESDMRRSLCLTEIGKATVGAWSRRQARNEPVTDTQ